MSYIYIANPGESITQTAKKMILLAKAHGDVTSDFNGIRLSAIASSKPDDIVSEYHSALEAARKAYELSPEFAKQKAAREIEIATRQTTANSLIEELRSLAFEDDVKVLKWLSEFQPVSDDVGIECNPSLVVSIFKDHGFEPSVNIGDNFNGEDRHNYFCYIVGQALDCLRRSGAIHHVVHTFIERWKAAFIADKAITKAEEK